MKRPHVLITNDDGVDSYFLRVLIDTHLPHFRVSVAAPKHEQSWIGRAFSRHRDISLSKLDAPDFTGWVIDGTPSDCINIALGHLLEEKPDVVISGINIGFNATMPLSLSSGTLAGAIEGAAWGIPSLAFSMELPDEEFEYLRHNQGKATGKTLESLKHAAAHAARFSLAQVGQLSPDVTVHNYNFPRNCSATTPLETTVPADVRLKGVYQKDTPTTYRFHWSKRDTPMPEGNNTDVACLRRGNISYTLLNYSALGR